ncbi:MAG: DUF2911 domain-containing protein [Planctomycetes bacterium]|nr:DUF2911 domain-containing protein [Planctomycetota bacterium]
MRITSPLGAVLLFVTTLCPVLCAQRGDAAVEWQKRTSAIDYGAVPVGKHGLDELQPGEQWRLGMNQATTWRTELPLVIGERVVPPGRYRLSFAKGGEGKGEITVQGSGHALGGKGDVAFGGALGESKKPTKALELSWEPDKKAKVNQPAALKIGFGEHEWRGDAVLLGGKEQKLGKGKLVAFSVPVKLVAGRASQPVPLATFEKGKGKNVERWNLVLVGDEPRLVPWGDVPTSNNGFDAIPAPSESSIVKGAMQVDKVDGAPEPADDAVVALAAAKAGKEGLELTFAAGAEKLTVTIAEPGK